MSWRTVVITKTSKLDYSLGYMIVRDVDNTVKIHSFLLMIKLLNKYTNTKLIICCNLSLYFLKSEIIALTETLKSMNVKMLNIENSFSDSFNNNCVLIIDNDLCEIIDNK